MKHTDILTDMKVARDVGFYGIELWMPKVEHYLHTGGTLENLLATAGSLRITMLNVLLSVERVGVGSHQTLRSQCRRMAETARQLDCPTLQVVALNDFISTEWLLMRRQLQNSLSPLADIASAYGVRLALEPVSFSPFHTLDHAVEVILEIGMERLGLVLDTWHLWTSNTPWSAVAKLDSALIACAHVSDSAKRSGIAWDDRDRTALPGDGVVPLLEGIAAIRNTGFTGSWTVELLGDQHDDWQPDTLARVLFERTSNLLLERPTCSFRMFNQ